MPTAAIVDPELLLGLPRELMASAALDALTQGIESFTSVKATPLTCALSIQAFQELSNGLPPALDDGGDVSALARLANGSLMAGMALANARLGVVHGLAHPLGIRYHIPHGIVCGCLLPLAIRFNAEAAREKYDYLSHLIGKPLIEFVEGLLHKAGMSGALKGYGIQADDFPAIADESLPSGSLKANPAPVSREDLIALMEQAIA